MTSNLRATGAAGWSTYTFLTASLVVSAGVEETVKLELIIILTSPGVCCAAFMIIAETLALVGVWYWVNHVKDIIRQPGEVRFQTDTIAGVNNGGVEKHEEEGENHVCAGHKMEVSVYLT